jgi:hypothetical protein
MANPDLLLMAQFNADCCQDQTALKLLRYEDAARRAYHQSLRQLLALKKHRAAQAKALSAQPVTQNYKTKPIPPPAPLAFTPPPPAAPLPAPESSSISPSPREFVLDTAHD